MNNTKVHIVISSVLICIFVLGISSTSNATIAINGKVTIANDVEIRQGNGVNYSFFSDSVYDSMLVSNDYIKVDTITITCRPNSGYVDSIVHNMDYYDNIPIFFEVDTSISEVGIHYVVYGLQYPQTYDVSFDNEYILTTDTRTIAFETTGSGFLKITVSSGTSDEDTEHESYSGNVLDYIVIICMIMVVSIACSMTRKGFSMGIFMASIATGISILVWRSSLPFYAMILAVIIIFIMLFRGGNESPIEEL